MPDGGKLTISLAEKSDDVTIAISDSGTGISKENMEKLFTPFFYNKRSGKRHRTRTATVLWHREDAQRKN